mmetsp:Transcript_11440/g.13868  ORF Transcript_11440/g.13868 Transcript_11440/m.13868 type:complete len:261 (-) Transcript_11440:287-1069(-)|eukprot:CAMPEP_0184039322 /NCGR_PEP_ID=MMETSP0955-20130417/52079_1 /TAXON_ID=627963 /ORGANISM="Aplanochytrium sp, Strain PBS07" /LENGTH=260 /DNA_ID=CAMNT_0026328439 /DNA_START=139 /DNA_END=921 /DNA_ORIENTATION=-
MSLKDEGNAPELDSGQGVSKSEVFPWLEASARKSLLAQLPNQNLHKVVRTTSLQELSSTSDRLRNLNLKDLHLPTPPVQRSHSSIEFSTTTPSPEINSSRAKGNGAGVNIRRNLAEDNARLVQALKEMKVLMDKTKEEFRNNAVKFNELQQYCGYLEAENSALHMHIDQITTQLDYFYAAHDYRTDFSGNDVSMSGASVNQDERKNQMNGDYEFDLTRYNEYEYGLENGDEPMESDMDEEIMDEEHGQYEDLDPKPVLQL